MLFTYEERRSDSPLVETVWRSQSERAGSFTSVAISHWEMVVTKQYDKIYLTVRGPETKATPAPVPENAEIFGIQFKLGTFMPHLPASNLVDGALNLPDAAHNSFWLNSSAWEFPNFGNAEVFVERLVREGLLVRDPVVNAVLQGQPPAFSPRALQYRFVRATGLSHKAIQQIQRARLALSLLQRGASILDTAHEVGYFDQSHLTNALKRFLGQTPAQIARVDQPDDQTE